MSLPQGIAFRSTIAFVTDVSPDYCENSTTDTSSGSVDAPTYPQTTPQGNNVGWETISGGFGQTRNRNNSNARLAGIHTSAGATDVNTYRIDLPTTGDKVIRLASGDFNYSANTNIVLKDTTTSLGTLASGSTSGAATWKDATNVERSSASDWATNNASVTKTFSTTILRLDMGTGSVEGTLSFFFVDVSGPTISVQPVQTVVFEGDSATFTITASGTGVLHYQWKKNGSNVGTDSNSYNTGATVIGDNLSTIQCVVTDDNGTANSNIVYLIVIETADLSWIKA
jgi:hypothetical protein